MSDVEAQCERCQHIVEVPSFVVNVVWNCPRCDKANESPVGSARYQRGVSP